MKATQKLAIWGGTAACSLGAALPALASDTSDMINETTTMVSDLWPLLILFLVLSLLMGIFGGLMSKFRFK
jgi:hypothetical protein